ncbi:MAG: HD domain-containing protein [Asticcacaulis sp.]|nr:HD domain-containing protein [Asticcacaulis sp.]
MTLPADCVSPPADNAQDFIDHVRETYASRGNDHYGEDISQREHAEQCAHHARAEGASDELIVAALLHDIGHLLHKFGEDAADRGIDTRHERIGSGFLARHLPKGVTEPIALHVRAKRYLATTNPAYLESLSGASLQSFTLQGGVMSAEEVEAFLAEPYHMDALKLRAYDELGKVVGLEMAGFDTYLPMIAGLAASR